MTCQQQKNINNESQQSCYVRNSGILERQIDGKVFLVNPETDTIFYLNQIGTAIWHLLARPTSVAEAASIIRQAFPTVPPRQITDDVCKLLNGLRAKGLVLIS